MIHSDPPAAGGHERQAGCVRPTAPGGSGEPRSARRCGWRLRLQPRLGRDGRPAAPRGSPAGPRPALACRPHGRSPELPEPTRRDQRPLERALTTSGRRPDKRTTPALPLPATPVPAAQLESPRRGPSVRRVLPRTRHRARADSEWPGNSRTRRRGRRRIRNRREIRNWRDRGAADGCGSGRPGRVASDFAAGAGPPAVPVRGHARAPRSHPADHELDRARSGRTQRPAAGFRILGWNRLGTQATTPGRWRAAGWGRSVWSERSPVRPAAPRQASGQEFQVSPPA